MIDGGDYEYVGPCNCGRKELIVFTIRDKGIKSAIKIVCDGRLYRYRPPGHSAYRTWCRSKRFSPEDLDFSDK